MATIMYVEDEERKAAMICYRRIYVFASSGSRNLMQPILSSLNDEQLAKSGQVQNAVKVSQSSTLIGRIAKGPGAATRV